MNEIPSVKMYHKFDIKKRMSVVFIRFGYQNNYYNMALWMDLNKIGVMYDSIFRCILNNSERRKMKQLYRNRCVDDVVVIMK